MPNYNYVYTAGVAMDISNDMTCQYLALPTFLVIYSHLYVLCYFSLFYYPPTSSFLCLFLVTRLTVNGRDEARSHSFRELYKCSFAMNQ